MSQITIGGTTLNFKDSAFTGDQWEQVASWVLNGGAEGIDANAQIATEKAAAASASAATARNSATSAGESAAAAASSATAASSSATAAEANADAAAGSATNAAASATSAGKSVSAASEKASDAANSAAAAAASAQTAQSAARTATDAASVASAAAEAASGSASQARESAAAAAESAASVDGINKTAQSWAVGGTGTREGEDTNNAKYWAEQAKEVAGGDFATKEELAAKPSMVIAEIPKGRMRGDVDGDGKITENDINLIQKHISSGVILTGIDFWCADVNGDNKVNFTDANIISKFLKGQSGKLTSTPTFADYYNNWTYHKVDDTSGYWTTELSIPAITAEMEGSIIWSGTGFAGTFIKAETFSGGVRIYANYPPIEALPCVVSYHTGAGGQFIIANTGVLETGAKYVVVDLKASGWSEEKKQIISVPGLKEDALKQLIIPTQLSTDIEKYYSAGIRISAREDNTLTFSCDTVPTAPIQVVLVIIPIVGRFEA